ARRRPRPARRSRGTDLRRDRDRRRAGLRLLVRGHPGAGADAGAALKRFFDYYRQFEELARQEVSRRLRERRDEERSRQLAEVPPLDLAAGGWHEPRHPEVVNAATFALRRAVKAYADPIAAPLGAAAGGASAVG